MVPGVEVDSWSSWVSLPLDQRIRMWRRGFLSREGSLYDFEAYDRDEHLGRLQLFQICYRMNGRGRYLLDDKLS